MPYKPVILWTDAFIYLLLGGGLVFAWTVRGREHLRAPWLRVARSRRGVISMTVLVFYLIVGLLDSVHFLPVLETGKNDRRSYGVEVVSLLDGLLSPLRQRGEKTYSAPFASHLFAKETVELSDGRQVRVFPRLVYGGAHLKDPERERTGDIALRGFLAMGLAGSLWILAGTALLGILARRRKVSFKTCALSVFRGEEDIPWKAVLLTVLTLFLVTVPPKK